MISGGAVRSAPDRKRRYGAALAIFVGAGVAAVLGWSSNFSIRGELPTVPFAAVVGPAKVAELRFAQLTNRGLVSPSLAARARKALAGAPLAYEPFLFSAAAEFQNERSVGTPQAVPLLREALRRNPRSRAALFLLMRRAVATKDLGTAVESIARLNRLGDGAGPLLIGMGRAVSTRAEVDDILRGLKRYPELLPGFVTGFLSVQKPTDVTVELASKLPPQTVADPAVGAALLVRLVDDGSFLAARQFWATAFPADSKNAAFVNDPEFKQPHPHPPFGWSLTQSSAGVAERQRGGGLDVEFYGREPGVLVSQLLMLPPGAYTVRLTHRPATLLPGGMLLSLVCRRSQAVLGRRELAAGSASQQTVSMSVIVPNGCEAQELAISGQLGERRAEQDTVVQRLDVLKGSLK